VRCLLRVGSHRIAVMGIDDASNRRRFAAMMLLLQAGPPRVSRPHSSRP